MLQHSMKFSFNEPHTWTQYGLALSTERRHLRSLIVFRELAEKNQGPHSIENEFGIEFHMYCSSVKFPFLTCIN